MTEPLPLEWLDDVAIGQDGTTYVVYKVKSNGDLWISGNNWKARVGPDGFKPHPNRIAKLGSVERAKRVADELNQIINTPPFCPFQRESPTE